MRTFTERTIKMRGATIRIGEYFEAKYYDVIPKFDEGKIVKINGKIQYTLDTIPYTFHFYDKEAGGVISHLGNQKGYNLKENLNNLGVFQTQQRAFCKSFP